MIQKSTFDFLKKLNKNNSKEWFDLNRPQYEIAKKDFIAFLEPLIADLSKFDTAVKSIEAKSCIFRINRDIRFAKDKTPYKTNFGASISPGGRKAFDPGYYVHLEPGKSFLAGGMWMPPAPQLAAIRQEIDYHPAEFKKIISNKEFVKYFKELSQEEKLQTAPKGYAKDHPELEILKLKSFIVVHNLEDEEVLSKNFLKHCNTVFKALYPLDLFLRRTLE